MGGRQRGGTAALVVALFDRGEILGDGKLRSGRVTVDEDVRVLLL